MPTVLDLFCGCGGFSYGFQTAGYEIVLGVDNDEAALKTFARNHLNSEIFKADLSDNNFDLTIRQLLGNKKVDVIIAGPPCQGFSLTGPRNFDDKRNKLYLAAIRLIDDLKPKAFVIENVPGLALLYGGAIKQEIIKRLERIGYKLTTDILCSADYGVPQIRKRLFFIGVKGAQSFQFPGKICNEKTYITCEAALSDLPTREHELGLEQDSYSFPPRTGFQKSIRNGNQILYNHVATKHTDLVKSVIALVPEGGNYKDLPPGVGTSRTFNEAWTRYHSQKPSRTIDTGHRNHFHYKYNRVPTIRENARLQSFPDSFVFLGTRTQQNRQVGNAVPPFLGYHIGNQLKKYFEK